MLYKDVEKVVAETIHDLENEFGIDLQNIGYESFDELVGRIFYKMKEWEGRKYEALSDITKNRELTETSKC